MPVFMQNPARFSIERLKSELISHRVKLPPLGSERDVYMKLYKKHVEQKTSPDFSSDDEDQVYNGNKEEEDDDDEEDNNKRKDKFRVVDLSLLTDDQLKCKLLQYGVKPGPIVGSTRALYERKLQKLMTQDSLRSVNSKGDIGRYSDSEEDEDEEEDQSESEQQDQDCVSKPRTKRSAVKKQERSFNSSQFNSKSFSITELVQEGSKYTFKPNMIENRLSPQSKSKDMERRSSQTPVKSSAYWDVQHLSKNAMANMSPYLTPECKKQTTTITPATEEVADVLTEMFPDATVTPTGITATKRRSIKGAAGRPVQFKYPETPLSPTTLERREIQQRLVPVWVQLAVFFFTIALLYFIYILTEESSENPFGSQLDALNQESINRELDLSSSSAAPEINTGD